MSGHSKWANIKHRKEKSDSQRGKIFTKIGREIAIAVREGGADPSSNSKLRDIVAKAKANNMPNDNITRSIKKAAGEDGNVNYEEITYEGYGPGGVAIIAQCITDNRNRTAGDVRHAFEKNGGSLGATGCVSWMFDLKGILLLERADFDEDEVMMDAIEAGAQEVVTDDEELIEIQCVPGDFSAVREQMEQKYAFLSAQVDNVPQNTAEPAEGEALKVQKLIDMLDDLDDVQQVYHNAVLPEEE